MEAGGGSQAGPTGYVFGMKFGNYASATVFSEAETDLLIRTLPSTPEITDLHVFFRYTPRMTNFLYQVARIVPLTAVTIHNAIFTYNAEDVRLVLQTPPVGAKERSQIFFNTCWFDPVSVRVFFRALVGCVRPSVLWFVNCKIGESTHSVPNIPVYRYRADEIHIHGSEKFIRAVLSSCANIFSTTLSVETDAPVCEWLPDLRIGGLEVLKIVKGRAGKRFEVEDDNGVVLPSVIRGIPGLAELHLTNLSGQLSAQTLSAIGEKPLRALTLRRCNLTDEAFRICVPPQRGLTMLDVSINRLTCDSVAALRGVISNNPLLRVLDISVSYLTQSCLDLVVDALLYHPSISVFRATFRTPDGSIWITNTYHRPDLEHKMAVNGLNVKIDGKMTVQIATPSAFITGPLREKVHAALGGSNALTPIALESYICGLLQGAGERMATQNPPDWWGLSRRDESSFADLREIIRQAPDKTTPAPATPAAPRNPGANWVTYVVEAVPPKRTGIDLYHIATVAGGALDAFIHGYDPASAEGYPVILVSEDEPTRKQRNDWDNKIRAQSAIVSVSSLPHALSDLRASVRVVDLLFTLAVLRYGALYISPQQLAAIAEEYDPTAILVNCGCFWQMPSGCVIARLPTLLENLRDLFASRLHIARSLRNRPGGARWYEDGCISPEAAAAVFNYALGTNQVPPEESLGFMAMFGIIFPVDQRRVVFPKFRRVPAVAYRVYACILGRPGVLAPQMDESGGVIRFYVQFGSARVQMEVYPSTARTVVALIGGSQVGDYTITSANIAGMIEQGIHEHLKLWSGY